MTIIVILEEDLSNNGRSWLFTIQKRHTVKHGKYKLVSYLQCVCYFPISCAMAIWGGFS